SRMPISGIRMRSDGSACCQVGVRLASGCCQLAMNNLELLVLSRENARETQPGGTPMKLKALSLAGIAIAMSAIPAVAHHSFAMFDAEKTKVLEGAIKEFQWTNPHSWILMTVNNDQGQAEQWAIEMGGPAGLARQGWVPKTLTPGMKVKTVIHPL